MSRPIPQAVYALTQWTIRRNEKDGKFYIAPTTCFDDKTRWSKPYDSLQRACTAIARKLASEWQQRDKRRREFYRLSEDAR
jgi:uncharacterized protein (DUF2461 family)